MIGRFSALACSNTVYITSYYEGTAYYYVMVKSGNSITTNLLMETPTTEKNGVEVTIKSVESLHPYINALNYIVFFPNVYVDYSGSEFNSIKLKKFTNFAYASIRCESKLLLGNVLYPCNASLLNKESKDFLYEIQYSGIVIKFEVGELNITPNRESIIYTSDTIKRIEDRIKEAKKELDQMVCTKLKEDYDDIRKYYDSISSSKYYDPITNEFNSIAHAGHKVFPANFISTAPITYNGQDLSGKKDFIHTILRLDIPTYKGTVDCNRICNRKSSYYNSERQMMAGNIVILNSGTRLINSIKIYLRENWEDYTIASYFTLDEFKAHVDRAIKGIPKDALSQVIVEGVYNSFMNRAKTVDLNTDSTYLKVKESLSSSNQGKSIEKEVILHVYLNDIYKTKFAFDNLEKAVDYIKQQKTGVLLVNMDTDDIQLCSVAKLRKFKVIKARKDIISAIRALNLSCIIDLNWVMNDDPILKKVAAILKKFPKGINTYTVNNMCNFIPDGLKKEFQEVLRYYNKYVDIYDEYCKLALDAANRGKYDKYTFHICELMSEYMKKHEEINTILNTGGMATTTSSEITTAVIIKEKKYRVSYNAYKKIKDNKLLNILCRK